MTNKTSRQPSRCVFIGNIAYDATKEQLMNIFKEVGSIVNFRMVTDRATGKPRGFAFCEYKDEASARSAMRNLTGRTLNGRSLRVDYADNNKINMPGDDESEMDAKPMTSGGTSGGGVGTSGPSGTNSSGGVPPFQPVSGTGSFTPSFDQGGPRGATIPPTQFQDPIMSSLSQLPKTQLYDAIAQMKQIAMSDPERARKILEHSPILAVIMLHIQYILGMIKTPFSAHPQQQQMPPLIQEQPGHSFHHTGGVVIPPHHHHHHHQPGIAPGMVHMSSHHGLPPSIPSIHAPSPSQISGQTPPHLMSHPHHAQMPPQVPSPTPSQQQVTGAPAVKHGQQPPPSNALSSQQQFQQLLKSINQTQLQQLLSLTPQQIEKLPPQERQQVLMIQQNMRHLAKGIIPQLQQHQQH